MDELQEARKIIGKARRNKKLLVEYPLWEKLSFDTRQQAINELKVKEEFINSEKRTCDCGCNKLFSLSYMVSQWDGGRQRYSLKFYEHDGYTKEEFRLMGYK